MIGVNIHFLLLVFLTFATAFTNSVYLIKHINFCKTCGESEYIREKAAKDVRGMAIAFIIFGGLSLLAFFLSKFSNFSGSRSNSAYRFHELQILVLVISMLYVCFSFMNYAAVAFKCLSSAKCRAKTEKFKEFQSEWLAVKTLNSLFFCVGASFLIFRLTCPRQKLGMPSKGSCKRILCLNKIRNQKELEKYKAALKKVQKEDDQSLHPRMLAKERQSSLKRENGERIRGDQLGFFDKVNYQINQCAGGERDRTKLLGFRANTWGANCSGITASTSEKKRLPERREKQRDEKQKARERERERRFRQFLREDRRRDRENR